MAKNNEPRILHKLRQFHVEVETLVQESEELHHEHSQLKIKLARMAHELLKLVKEVQRECGDCLKRMQQMNVKWKRRDDDSE